MSLLCSKSSTQQPWVDWLLPGDGQSRNTVVGVNNAYPGAPASDVVDRVGARIGEGRIWLTQPPVASALLPHPPVMDAHGAAVVRVRNGGASYEVFAHTDAGEQEAMSYTSTS
ncbi:MAG: hypothetical protein DRI90_01190 [Deltaproteobacteria bacterium]|nr:MAG: hypothetical protein DRI90_01190 [Deltaproteobacteria bacterium]